MRLVLVLSRVLASVLVLSLVLVQQELERGQVMVLVLVLVQLGLELGQVQVLVP